MFSLLSTRCQRSVEYWEGWQAVELHKQCTYTDPKQRKEWAKGFADGVKEMRGNKSWYKSRTMIVGLFMLAVGVGLIGYGLYFGGPSEKTLIGAGTGVTAMSIVMAALRLITNSNISLGGGGGGQYTPPPFTQ
jgi:hypothetical protein